MTDGIDRDALIELLEKLGSADDAEVVAAAREIDVRVKGGGATWNDLLVADAEPATTMDDPDPVASVPDDVPSESKAGPPPDDSESARLIESLLAMKELSPELREELEGYKQDMADGEFGDMDRSYLRSLHKRLTKS